MLSSSIHDYYSLNVFVLLVDHRKKFKEKRKSRPSSSCHLELQFCTAQSADTHSTLQGTQVVMMYFLVSTTIHLYINQILSRKMSKPCLKAGATVKTSKSWDFIEVHGLAEAFKPPAL